MEEISDLKRIEMKLDNLTGRLDELFQLVKKIALKITNREKEEVNEEPKEDDSGDETLNQFIEKSKGREDQHNSATPIVAAPTEEEGEKEREEEEKEEEETTEVIDLDEANSQTTEVIDLDEGNSQTTEVIQLDEGKEKKGMRKLKQLPKVLAYYIPPDTSAATSTATSYNAIIMKLKKPEKRKEKEKCDEDVHTAQKKRKFETQPTPKTPQISTSENKNPPTCPFNTPDVEKIVRMEEWKYEYRAYNTKRKIRVGKYSVDPYWFTKMEDTEKNLDEEHINGALIMFGNRISNNFNYYSEKGLPRADFFYTTFFKDLSRRYSQFNKNPSSYVWDRKFVEIVELGEWVESVDVLYGAFPVREGKKKLWVGMAIDFKKRKIIVLGCDPKTNTKEFINKNVKPFTEIIPSLTCASIPEYCKSPFRVETLPTKNIPKIYNEANLELFLVKMIEWHSGGIEDASNMTDEMAKDIRQKLASDIFDQFYDKNSQE